MSSSFGLLLGAGLVVGLVVLALVISLIDSKPSETDGNNKNQITNIADSEIQPVDSVKDDQSQTAGDDNKSNTKMTITYSDYQQGQLVVSLIVDTVATDCQFQLTTPLQLREMITTAPIMRTPQQQGCNGRFGNVAEIGNQAKITVELQSQTEVEVCDFYLRGESTSPSGRELFWESKNPACIGNFNP